MTDLFDEQVEADEPKRRKTIQERFEAFHARHPDVLLTLARFGRELLRRGNDKGAIEMLWGRLRWHYHVDRDAAEEFKLNNNFTSRYVRKLIQEYPEFDGFFELRILRTP